MEKWRKEQNNRSEIQPVYNENCVLLEETIDHNYNPTKEG